MSTKLGDSIHLVLKKTAIKMLREEKDLKYISSVTGFSEEELLKFKSTI